MAILGRRRGRPREAPVVTGVIDSSGPSANSGPPGTAWTGVITLLVWRDHNGEVRTEPLRIEQALGKGDTAPKGWMRQFSAGETVRLALAGPVEQRANGCRAQLAAKLDAKEDDALRATAAPLLSPPPYVDPVLGRFVPHPRMPSRYAQDTVWLGHPLELALSTQKAADLPGCAAAAAALLRDAARWQAAADKMVVDRLYHVWRDEWREQGDAMLDHAEFLARLGQPALTVYPDGYFEFEWQDGGLFLGHMVMATGSIEDGLDDAGIAG